MQELLEMYHMLKITVSVTSAKKRNRHKCGVWCNTFQGTEKVVAEVQ